MPKRTRPYRDSLLEDLRDPNEAVRYLNGALEESERSLLVALRNVADSNQMSRVAEAAGVTREALYKMLSDTGNPTYANFNSVLKALGLKFVIQLDCPHQLDAEIDSEDRQNAELLK